MANFVWTASTKLKANRLEEGGLEGKSNIWVNMIKDNISKSRRGVFSVFFLCKRMLYGFLFHSDKICTTKQLHSEAFLCFLIWYFSLTYDPEWMKYNIWQDCKNEMACSSSTSMSTRICSYASFIARVVLQNYVLQALVESTYSATILVRMKWNCRLTHFDMSTIQFLICADR